MRREFISLHQALGHTFEGDLDSCDTANKILLFSGSLAVLLVTEGDDEGSSISNDFPHGHDRLIVEWGFDKGELIANNLLSDEDLVRLHEDEQKRIAGRVEVRRRQYEELKKEFGDG